MAITVLQEKESQNISVFVRVRPPAAAAEPADWEFKQRSICHVRNGCKKDYVLDNVFSENCDTNDVYQQTTQPLVKTVLEGFSCTVFAYGQTNSGKTFTMRGSGSEGGIVGRAIHDLFIKMAQHPDRQFCLRASYMEIYNEEVNDLLNPEKRNLNVKVDQDSGVMVAGLSEVLVYSMEDVMRLLSVGDSRKHIGETKMNDKSSRSHSIFKMVVESTPMEGEANQENGSATDSGSFAVKIGVLNMVDLAGSERITKTGAEGSRLKEGVNINKSLLTLGLVIKNLSEGASQAGRHIPYRDSKLTRILQPSLGGNAKTAIICMITPDVSHVDESHNTLEFATRAKKVVNEVAAVETMTSAALLKRQANEIEKLKAQLCQDGSENVAKQVQELQQKLLDMEKAMEIKAATIEVVTKEKEFFEKRNMDLSAASKRAAQKRARARRETIAHFGPAVDDADGAGSPCSGATRDSDMSGEPVNPGESGVVGACAGNTALLPVIGEEDAVSGVTELQADDDPDVTRQRKLSRGAASPHRGSAGAPSGGGHDSARMSAGGAAAPQRAAVAQEPFAEELRGVVSRLKAQLAERDAALAERDAALLAAQAQVETEKSNAASELEKMRLTLMREQYERRRLTACEEETVEAVSALQQQLDEAGEEAALLRKELSTARSSIAELEEERSADAREAAAHLREAQEELAKAESAVEKAHIDIKLLQERDRQRLMEVDSLAHEAKALREEREAALRGAASAGQGSARIAEELRDCQDEVERLKSHVSDLESRKRPPLYQRKQEEELKAANDHATECEARTTTAEAALKVAQDELAVVTTELAELRTEAGRAAARHTEQMDELRVNWQYDVSEAKSKAAKVEAEMAVQIEDLQEKADHFSAFAEELEAKLNADTAAMQAKIAEVKQTLAERQAELLAERQVVGQWEEALSQTTAVVAKLEEEAAAQEKALEAANQAKEAIQAAAAEDKAAIVASHEAAVQEATQQHQAAVAKLSATLASAVAEHEAALAAAKQTAAQAQEAAEAEHAAALAAKIKEMEALGAHAHKLQEKLDESPAAFKALTELKELRVKYKQEVSSLHSQLKAANVSNKGGDKAKQLLQREFEKLQKKQVDTESKLRSMTAEKQQLTSDKASQERKIKQLEMQVSKSSKDVEKKEATVMKKLEASQEALNKAKEDFGKLEAKFFKARDDNGRLTAAQGVLEGRLAAIDAELKESQRVCSEEEEHLAEVQKQYMELEEEHEELQAKCKEAVKNGEVLDADRAALSEQLATVQAAASASAKLVEELQALAKGTQQKLDNEKAQHKLAREDLSTQVEAREQEVAKLKAKMAEMVDDMAVTDEMARSLLGERDAAQDEAQAVHSRAEDAEAELETVRQRLAEANDALAAHDAELHARNADVDAREREIRNLRREVEGLEAQLTALQGSRGEQEREAEAARAAAVAELREVREELHKAQQRAAHEAAAAAEVAATLRDARSAASRADAARETLAVQAVSQKEEIKALTQDVQTLEQKLASAKSAETGLRSREDIARKSEAQARLSADRNADTAATLQDELSRARSELTNVRMELQELKLSARTAGQARPVGDGATGDATQDEVRQLREMAATLQTRLDEAAERQGVATVELQSAQRSAEQAAATAAAMREAAEAAEKRAADLEEKLQAALVAAADAAEEGAEEEVITELKQEIMDMEAAAELLQEELRQRKKAEAAHREQVAGLQAAQQEAVAQAHAAMGKAQQLEVAAEAAQAQAVKAVADHTEFMSIYKMQKQYSRRLECVQETLHKELHKRFGVPEDEVKTLLAWLQDEYNRRFHARQLQKQKRAAEQAAAQAAV
eukprot:jgi/Ulvmu1/12401/UM009_0048.1